MQPIEPFPASENFPLGLRSAGTDVSVRWDSGRFTAPVKPEFVAEHDETRLPVALDEIEGKRLALEALQDDDLFKLCL